MKELFLLQCFRPTRFAAHFSEWLRLLAHYLNEFLLFVFYHQFQRQYLPLNGK